MPSNLEIERKFLINENEWNLFCTTHSKLVYMLSKYKIEQFFIKVESSNVSLRVRRTGSSHELTVKVTTSGVGSFEITEENIGKDAYNALAAEASGVIHKTREVWYFGALTFELDRFTKPKELTMLEIEFDSEESRDKFNPADYPFIALEVTNDPAYSNKNMV